MATADQFGVGVAGAAVSAVLAVLSPQAARVSAQAAA
jgi:hypothetical protein